jgi:hypothetical protein
MLPKSFLVWLGGGRSAEQPRQPKAYARLASAVLGNPVGMVAYVVADSEFGRPVSELAANGRILNIARGSRPTRDAAEDVNGGRALSVVDDMPLALRGLPASDMAFMPI